MSWSDPCSRCGEHRADCNCNNIQIPIKRDIKPDLKRFLEHIINNIGETTNEYTWREASELLLNIETTSEIITIIKP